MTTKKDFIAAAKIISAISEKSEKQQVADNFVLIFKNQNQRFDSAKFYKACGL